ncbi:MAG: Stp1/IreP family PP2C-type Ser/Thr phosphatase [Deltaproteobacteria bacterium]|nr:Stp1/IreP family PP2C-type Ser/Thr phosphatase [Deltaproteobacteria bacterium]
MRVEGWAKSDVGRKRNHNEDAFYMEPSLGLYMVCDGMGGHAAGEVASAKAVEVVKAEVARNKTLLEDLKAKDTPTTREKVIGLVEKSVQKACAEIHDMSQKESGKAGMGTTLVMVVMVGDHAVMGHVGDSRLYMQRGDKLHQMSEDHSYVTEMIKRGKMTKEEARRSPYNNVITRAVGIQPSVQVDTLFFDVLPGDTYLLCSDGLHGYTEDNDELGKLLGARDAEALPGQLVDLANNRGGKDNITAIIIRALAEGGEQPQEAARAEEVNLKLETLKKIPLFRHLTYQELVKVLNITYLQVYDAGTPVVKEGQEGEELFIILSGRVVVSKGGQEIVELHPGVHFGEMALVDQSPRSATVTARENTRVLVIGRKQFYALIRKEPVLAVKLLWSFVQVLSHRLRETNEQLQGAKSELEQAQAVPFLEVDME